MPSDTDKWSRCIKGMVNMKNEQFKEGDFIRLSIPHKHKNNLVIDNEVNIFKLVAIEKDLVRITLHDYLLPLSEILPIPINGVDDARIYYDPVIAAGIYLPGQKVIASIKDQSYYMESFKKMHVQWLGKSKYEDVIEKGFKYVHEIQHYLKEVYHEDSLYIDSF